MGTKHILCYVLLIIIATTFKVHGHTHRGKKCAASEASGSCCNPGHPGNGMCGEGEGDCDDDSQCLRGLKCGVDNCPKENGMPRTFDCCYRPTPGKKCATSDASGSCCNPGQPGDGKCGEDEGDCDNDAQCQPGLKCGDDNCPKGNGMPNNFDCCYKPTPVCIVNGGWTPWGSCSRSCKGGEQKRTCTNPPPSYNGKECYGRNIQLCNRYIVCDGGWTPWGSCSKSCEGGEQKRICTMCDGREKKRCNRNINCAVNGSWTPWGSCSKSCNGGEQKRLCSNPPPSYGGRGCDGRNTQECNSNINCLLFLQREEMILKKGNLITTLPRLGKQYLLSVEFIATSVSGTRSIIHLTTVDRNSRDNGARIPGVWIDNWKLYIDANIDGKNIDLEGSNIIPTNKWINIQFSQKFTNGKYMFTVLVDGKQLTQKENTKPQEFTGVMVYAANKWHDPLQGSIRNFFLQQS